MNKRFSIFTLVAGLTIFMSGAVFFCLDFFAKPDVRDAEYLVNVGTWVQQSDSETPSVIWQFTEIGKGTLTTNNHKNDYDFIWALDGDTLKIETAWLYNLENEYTYKINQSAGTFTLTAGDQAITFVPLAD